MAEKSSGDTMDDVKLDRNACIDQIAALDTLAVQLKAGVPILLAFENAKVHVPQYAAHFQTMYDSIREGDSVANAMRKCRAFPNYIIQLTDNGEETGELDLILDDMTKLLGHQLKYGFGPNDLSEVLLYRGLATMIAAGFDIRDAFELLSPHMQYPPEDTRNLMAAQLKVHTLGDVMGANPNYFSRLAIDVVQAGEGTKKLDVVLDALADYQERMIQLRAQIDP
jgi:type II secretory pathway component PulF